MALKILIFALLLFNARAETLAYNEFLSVYEYGRALYKNPRGIGCAKCHGANGSGAIIAKYKQNGKIRQMIAPKIRGLTFVRFENALENGKGLMPKYKLTIAEKYALYHFLNPDLKLK